MTIGRNPNLHVLFGLLAVLAPLILYADAIFATPVLDVQIGFGGHVVSERFAPVRIRVEGYDSPTAATLLIIQSLGNPWRGAATVRQQPTLAVAIDGVYHTTIPIYDPLNPIRIALVDSNGATLAEQEVNLRPTRHLDPFPLTYGILPHPLSPDGIPPIHITELPKDWWALDAAQSLWISGAPPQSEWDTIEQWVFAGGSVVIFSGSDFFRLDSPVVRRLLPLRDPILVTAPPAIAHLAGTRKTGSDTVLRRAGVPLLVIRRYGAGYVALVTVRGADLTRDELGLVANTIPTTTRLTLADFAERELGELPVVRPGHPAALLLGLGGVAGLAACGAIGRKHRLSGVLAALGLCVFGSVWSGFYVNRNHTVVPLYSISTSLSLHALFGSYVDTSSFVWPRTARFVDIAARESIPVQIVTTPPGNDPLASLMPASQASPTLFEHSFLEGRISVPMQSGARKTFFSCRASPSLLQLAYDDTLDVFVLHQGLGEAIDEAWLILDGFGFHITSVPHGTIVYSQEAVRSLRELTSLASSSSQSALRFLSDIFPFDRGVWLIGRSARWVESREEPIRKVRLVSLHVAEGVHNE